MIGLWPLLEKKGYIAPTSRKVPLIKDPTAADKADSGMDGTNTDRMTSDELAMGSTTDELVMESTTNETTTSATTDETTTSAITDEAALDEPLPGPVMRVDVLGSFFTSVRHAFTTRTADNAHMSVENAILSSGIPKTAILYIDGEQTEEKKSTQDERAEKRTTAAQQAQKVLQTLEDRLDGDRKLHKHHFSDATKIINRSFYWSLESRQDFAAYLSNNGWTVRLCPFEADVAIAAECQPDDFVVSGDSDMIAYGSIQTIIRPFRGKFLRYDLGVVLKHLGMSREQLTALAIVSRNDYNRNISSLGPKSNYDIIKTLEASGKLNVFCSLFFCPNMFIDTIF